MQILIFYVLISKRWDDWQEIAICEWEIIIIIIIMEKETCENDLVKILCEKWYDQTLLFFTVFTQSGWLLWFIWSDDDVKYVWQFDECF